MLMPSCLTQGHIRGTRPSLPALLPTSSSIGEWRGGCVVAAAVTVVVVVELGARKLSSTWGMARICRDPGSNRGPSDLQSDALPTELSRLGELPESIPSKAVDTGTAEHTANPFSGRGCTHGPHGPCMAGDLGVPKGLGVMPRPGIEPGTFRSSV